MWPVLKGHGFEPCRKSGNNLGDAHVCHLLRWLCDRAALKVAVYIIIVAACSSCAVGLDSGSWTFGMSAKLKPMVYPKNVIVVQSQMHNDIEVPCCNFVPQNWRNNNRSYGFVWIGVLWQCSKGCFLAGSIREQGFQVKLISRMAMFVDKIRFLFYRQKINKHFAGDIQGSGLALIDNSY